MWRAFMTAFGLAGIVFGAAAIASEAALPAGLGALARGYGVLIIPAAAYLLVGLAVRDWMARNRHRQRGSSPLVAASKGSVD